MHLVEEHVCSEQPGVPVQSTGLLHIGQILLSLRHPWYSSAGNCRRSTSSWWLALVTASAFATMHSTLSQVAACTPGAFSEVTSAVQNVQSGIAANRDSTKSVLSQNGYGKIFFY
jgi:hypothetical protein